MPAISDINDLQNMALDLAGDYWLTNDIDATITQTWNWDGTRFLGFNPVGNFANRFTGTFNGAGYSIRNLFINRPATVYVGLFGFTDGATIQDITLADEDFTGQDDMGGLIGYTVDTIINNCSILGSIIGRHLVGGIIGCSDGTTSLEECSFNGTIESDSVTGELGGIIGCAYGTVTINGCSVAGTIGHYPYTNSVGGIVGENRANLIMISSYTSCVVIGENYVGGLVGISGWGGILNISTCFTLGNITGYGDGVGGLIGVSSDTHDLILNCYARGNVTGDEAVGGAFGSFYDGKFGYIYSTGLVTGNDYVGGLHGYGDGIEDLYPCYWDIEKSGQATSITGEGKTTEEMNHRDIYVAVGWNLDTIWNISKVSTGLCTNITSGTATLNGLLDLTIINEAYPFLRWQTVVELPCDCGFEWGETLDLGNFTPVASKNTGDVFAQALSGLKPQTKYYFRSRAHSSPGPIHGGIGTFTTAVGIEVETLPATNITENSARIWGVVRKVPVTAMGRFDWGGSIDYGIQTPWEPGLVSDDMFYFDLANLAEGRAYHFRAVAMGSSLVYGNDMTFTTLTPLGPVTLIQEELAHIMEVS
jgi:hypothetical protein